MQHNLLSAGHNKKKYAVALLCSVITIMVYLPALRYDFVNWDDPLNVYENPYIRSLDFNLLKYMLSFQDTMWIPITRLSHALNYAAWGLDASGHHLTNIILHGLNTFLVVIFIVRLTDYAKSARSSARPGIDTASSGINALIAGGLTGILFGIHPQHVESVAWVTARKDVLSGFFMLLSLLAYLKFVSDPLKNRRRAYYTVSLVSFAMALMSKPIAVIFPAVLVILDIYPFERLKFDAGLKSPLNIIKEKIPFFALSILLSVVTILSYQSEGIEVLESGVSFTDRLLISVHTLCFYLFKMLWPVNLAPLYTYPLKASVLTIKYGGPLLLVSGITFFCVCSWKKKKIWAAVWAYYIVTLLPVLGLVQYGDFAAADRYTYMPSLGPFLLMGLGAGYAAGKTALSQRIRVLIFIPVVFLLFSLILLTSHQLKIWKNSLTLWNREVEAFPEFDMAYKSRGWTYTEGGKHALAIADYDMAIKINPRNTKAYIYRGISYAALGNSRKAIENFNSAIMIDPEDTVAFYNRGICYKNMGSFQRAISDFSLVIEKGAYNRILVIETYHKRGDLYSLTGNYKKAVEDYSKLIEFFPRDAEIYNKRGIAFSNLGNYHNGIEDFSKAVHFKPDYVEAYNNRGNLYSMTGRYSDALNDFDMAIQLNPGATDIYFNRGMLYLKMHNDSEALKDFKHAAKSGDKKAQEYLKTLE